MNIHKKDLQQLQEMYNKISEHILDDIIDVADPTHDEHSDCDDAISMAKTQLLNIMHNVQEMLDVIEDVEHFEPWMTGMLSNADCSLSKLKEVVLFRE